MKSVQIEQSVEHNIINSTTPTGLLIGQCWDVTRPYVFHTIPTPPLPSSVSHVDWFLSHARTTSRSLCGGLDIIGMYINNVQEYKKLEQRGDIKSMIFGLPIVNSSICPSASSSSSSFFFPVDRYLLRCSPYTLEYYTTPDAKPKSTQLKFTKLKQDSIQEYRTELRVEFDVPIKKITDNNTLTPQLQSQFDDYSAYIMKYLWYDQDDTQSIEKSIGGAVNMKQNKKGKSKKEDMSQDQQLPIHVDLLAQPYLYSMAEAVEGVIHIHGVIQGRAYAHKKQTVGQAINALKYDLANSLQNRLSLLVEDEVEVNGEFKLPIMPFFAWGLPRRVFIDIGDICVCDYLLSHELEHDACQRLGELFSTDLSSARIDAIEHLGEQESQTYSIHPQQEEMKEEFNKAKQSSRKEVEKSSAYSTMIAAFGALALAITAGWASDWF